MHIIFPSSDLIEDVVSEDLIVFNNTSNLKFLHSVGDFEDLGLLVPDQTVDFQSVDLIGERDKIETSLVDLHLEDNDGLGNRLLFLLLGLNLRLRFLGNWSSGLIITEEIDLVLSLLSFNLGGSRCEFISPCLEMEGREGSDMKVPVV